MPIRKLRLSKAEEQEHRNSLSRLERMGITVGYAVDPSHEPERITLEQTEYEVPRIYELPLDEIVVVVPARMTIREPGMLITYVAIITPWEDCPLELCDPEDTLYYEKVIGGLYHLPPTILNPLLMSDLPLRRHQLEGVIIAHGYTAVPCECQEESLVRVALSLTDGRRNKLSFEFEVELSRSVMRKREKQRQRERRAIAQSPGEWGLYQPHRGHPGEGSLYQPERKQPVDQKRVSPEKPSSSDNQAVSITQPVTQENDNKTDIEIR